MSDVPLDEVDRAILYELQTNARHNTNAAISDRVGVSASTVGKRIAQLEDRGIINGYYPGINYEKAGFPLHVLFICTASIANRAALIEETLKIEGVLNVRELMTGEENVHIRVIGAVKDDITHIAQTLDNLGYSVADEILLREEYTQPSVHFDV